MQNTDTFSPNPDTLLKDVFGYDEFRTGQRELIDCLLAGRDVLGIMPTGAGKSVCYQIPAALLPGVTIVVSPLISLMQDQVNALRQSGISAAAVTSALSFEEIYNVMELAAWGQYKLLYVAPERLLSPNFLSFATGANISLLAVDEAHCVSQWGHDFRLSYRDIPQFVARLPKRPPLGAFTATATGDVRGDIVKLLQLREPYTLVTGFDRPNLYFGVTAPRDKNAELMRLVGERSAQNGIVYCSTRKNVEAVHQMLTERGYSAGKYHAGMPDAARAENQDDFLYDRVKIMVATVAFGMGIDKSNVSYVIHYNIPKSMENYYQEAGRAGRDGSPAQCILIYSAQDVRIQEFIIKKEPEPEMPSPYDLSPQRDEEKLRREHELRMENHASRVTRELAVLKQMVFYATARDCLRGRLLGYFGEKPAEACGNCSSCLTPARDKSDGEDYENVDVTLEAKKLICCVFRLSERGKRFGLDTVCEILLAGKNPNIEKFGLASLSTYGIMPGYDKKRLRAIAELMIEGGYLERSYIGRDSRGAVIDLGARSDEIIRGGEKLVLDLPTPEKKGRRRASREAAPSWGLPRENSPALGEDIDDELLLKLKELRRRLAEKERVPAFVVFSDATLRDICRVQPLNDRDFLTVHGVGEVKARRYGAAFIALVKEHIE